MTIAKRICLIVPGLDNSGPGHWQTLWEAQREDCRRVDFGCWSNPDPAIWLERLNAAIDAATGPITLVAHSLGCLAVAHWAGEARDTVSRVDSALLVAPPDVDAPDALPVVRRFAPTPRSRLPFRSMLVASRDDPYASVAASQAMALAWGSLFVDAGRCGHINAAAGVGEWSVGQYLLAQLQDSCVEAKRRA